MLLLHFRCAYKTKNNREVDFLLKKGIEIEQLIRVCYRIDEIKTKDRECRALNQYLDWGLSIVSVSL